MRKSGSRSLDQISRYMVSSLLVVIACMRDVYNIRGEVFSKGIGFKIGGGSSTCLWVDDWLRVGVVPVHGI